MRRVRLTQEEERKSTGNHERGGTAAEEHRETEKTSKQF
jgi:hypothetical protein